MLYVHLRVLRLDYAASRTTTDPPTESARGAIDLLDNLSHAAHSVTEVRKPGVCAEVGANRAICSSHRVVRSRGLPGTQYEGLQQRPWVVDQLQVSCRLRAAATNFRSSRVLVCSNRSRTCRRLGDDHSFEQSREQRIDVAQDEIVQRRGIRNDDAHERGTRIFSSVAASASRSVAE
jgi:hypothetical protein